jgi:hypothetical protein
VDVRVIRDSDGSSLRCVELRDEDGASVRVSDAGGETWQCSMCERQLHGGIRVSGASSLGWIELCEWCVRAFARSSPGQLLESWRTKYGEGLATAERVVADVDTLVDIYPRWRLMARWRIRRKAYATRRDLHEYTQYLAEHESDDSIAEMVEGFKEIEGVIDSYFGDQRASPLAEPPPRRHGR